MSKVSTSFSEFILHIPPLVVPVAQIPINFHRMQTMANYGFTQPLLEPRILLTHIEPNSVK